MQLQQLRFFLAVAKTGNFSQSAQQLGISQPVLSRHIQQLEQNLGITLFDRYHRPLQLTEAGRFLQQHSADLLQELYQILDMTQRFGKPLPSQLTIGFVASILYGFLPEIISEIKSTHPKLDIKLLDVSSDAQPMALKSGEIDVGFGRFAYHDPLIRQIFLRHERLVAALPISHPLARQHSEDGITFRQLVDERLIIYHRTALPVTPPLTQADPLLQLFERHYLQPKHTMKVRDLQIALGLVAAGEGVTLVPDSLKTVRTEQIHYHALATETATLPIYMNILASHPHPALKDLLTATYRVYEQKGVTYSQTLI